jgi:hypothetical protein
LVFLFLGYRSFGTKTLTKQEAKSNLLWKRCPTGGWVGVELPEAAEGFANEISGGQGGIESLKGFLRFSRFVAEGEEGTKGILRVS